MAKDKKYFFVWGLFAFSLVVFMFSIVSVSSEVVDCFRYTGNYSACSNMSANCFWSNNSGIIPSDPYCSINYNNYNSTLQTMFLPWLQIEVPFNSLTAGLLVNSGCCMMKAGSGGGSFQGCQQFNSNQTGCMNSYTYIQSNCTWKPNNINQNPMCNNNVGCCEQLGCWSFGGIQTAGNNCTTAFNGLCSLDTFCPSGDCCRQKSCGEVSTQLDCDKLKQKPLGRNRLDLIMCSSPFLIRALKCRKAELSKPVRSMLRL